MKSTVIKPIKVQYGFHGALTVTLKPNLVTVAHFVANLFEEAKKQRKEYFFDIHLPSLNDKDSKKVQFNKTIDSIWEDKAIISVKGNSSSWLRWGGKPSDWKKNKFSLRKLFLDYFLSKPTVTELGLDPKYISSDRWKTLDGQGLALCWAAQHDYSGLIIAIFKDDYDFSRNYWNKSQIHEVRYIYRTNGLIYEDDNFRILHPAIKLSIEIALARGHTSVIEAILQVIEEVYESHPVAWPGKEQDNKQAGCESENLEIALNQPEHPITGIILYKLFRHLPKIFLALVKKCQRLDILEELFFLVKYPMTLGYNRNALFHKYNCLGIDGFEDQDEFYKYLSSHAAYQYFMNKEERLLKLMAMDGCDFKAGMRRIDILSSSDARTCYEFDLTEDHINEWNQKYYVVPLIRPLLYPILIKFLPNEIETIVEEYCELEYISKSLSEESCLHAESSREQLTLPLTQLIMEEVTAPERKSVKKNHLQQLIHRGSGFFSSLINASIGYDIGIRKFRMAPLDDAEQVYWMLRNFKGQGIVLPEALRIILIFNLKWRASCGDTITPRFYSALVKTLGEKEVNSIFSPDGKSIPMLKYLSISVSSSPQVDETPPNRGVVVKNFNALSSMCS